MRDSKLTPASFSKHSTGSRVSDPDASRKQERAVVTRAQLLDSARKIFARDGFELARIEDISNSSGKTRGAFYANFKDKEDVFLAIFEADLALDKGKVWPLLLQFDTLEQRVDALAGYLGEVARDRQRTLLMLEFKIYAIRHPERRKRLAELRSLMRQKCALPELFESLPERDQRAASSGGVAPAAIGAILDGLALNRLFDPVALDDAQMVHSLRLCAQEALSSVSVKRSAKAVTR